MWVTSSLSTVLTPTAVALGNFDGLHQGHWQVIQPVVNPDRQLAMEATGKLAQCSANVHQLSDAPHDEVLVAAYPVSSTHQFATVVTFNPHPREFFTGESQALLTPLVEKVLQLQMRGVEQLMLLPFDRELAELSPQEFVEKILVQHLRAQRVSVGEDFCFGRQRAGRVADLKAIAHRYGVEVISTPLQSSNGEKVSSSAIRQALQAGDLSRANQLLGRPYSLMGQVVQGQQLGRTLGFPTANLQLPTNKFLPRTGVYCVQVYRVEQGGMTTPPLPGVMNLGWRPTVNGVQQTTEVHLLDWSGDLYGQTLIVDLLQFLRPEEKFASLDALKTQIQADCDATRSLLSASTSSS